MKKIQCIFCNEKKEKAKEHIWPRWLQIQLLGSTKSNFSGTYVSFTNPELITQRNQSGESLVFGSVCKDCNGVWMHKLETDFKKCFTKIQKNYNRLKALDKKDRLVISLWGLKTAMMINSGSNYRKIIPQKHYRYLYKFRQIPKDVKVEIGYINNDKLLNWAQSTISFAMTKNYKSKTIAPNDLPQNSYIISMQIEHLGIKVIYYKDCKERKCEIPLSKDSKSLRIWPYMKDGKFNIKNGYNEIEDFNLNTFLIRN